MLSRFWGVTGRASEPTDISMIAQETEGCQRVKEPRVHVKTKGHHPWDTQSPRAVAADGLFLIFSYLICIN